MILENRDFFKLKLSHAKDILKFLISQDDEFNIICKLEGIKFNPDLPSSIKENFREIIIFSIANYTLSTAKLNQDYLEFEAGFGKENFGSLVTVPIKNIIQITDEDENPLFVNISATLIEEEEEIKNPFELNPRNKKFLE